MNPASSSAERMAATMPSIIPLGPRISAPALAWLTATRPSTSRVASLSTAPSRTMPQCPWLVYSQQQRSVMSSRSGYFCRRRRSACWTIPSSEKFSVPTWSLDAGIPKRITPADIPGLGPGPPRGRGIRPRRAGTPRASRGSHARPGCRAPRKWAGSGRRGRAVLAHESRMAAVRLPPPGSDSGREGHGGKTRERRWARTGASLQLAGTWLAVLFR